jgi:hypothetical protein
MQPPDSDHGMVLGLSYGTLGIRHDPLLAPRAAEMPRLVPTGAADRKNILLARGLLDYFPAALMAVAEVSRLGNEQHNRGQVIHWARGKSSDHADCILRHLIERGTPDTDGVPHSAKVAWRALALLQEELEAAGAVPGRASVFPERVP